MSFTIKASTNSSSKAKSAPHPNAGKSLKELGLENFEVIEVKRADLKGAPYNPRHMNDIERAKLKKGLQQHGMVSPVTWNKRTGNVVGGHQRLSQLDALAKTKDYSLHVAVIDVPLAQEKELNLLLNNPEAMGAWDLEKMAELFKDKSVRVEATGFDQVDLFRLLGDSPFTQRGEDAEVLVEQLKAARAGMDSSMGVGKKAKEKDNPDFYIVVVFDGSADLEQFLEKHDLLKNRFQSGAQFRKLLGEEV